MPTVIFGDRPFETGLVVFDKDGTLIDFEALWVGKVMGGVERLVTALPLPEGVREEIYSTLGYEPVSNTFAPQGPIVTAAMDKIYTIVAAVLYRSGYDWLRAELLVDQHVVPGMEQAFAPDMLNPLADLRQLFADLRAAGVQIAVVTSDEHDPTQRTLEVLGLDPYVGFLAACDDEYAHKPAPDAVVAACRVLGVEAERTAVVGDTSTDLVMAKRAGVGLRVGVTSGLMTEEALEPFADVVLASVGAITVPERAGVSGA